MVIGVGLIRLIVLFAREKSLVAVTTVTVWHDRLLYVSRVRAAVAEQKRLPGIASSDAAASRTSCPFGGNETGHRGPIDEIRHNRNNRDNSNA